MYGSVCGSSLQSYASISHVPVYVWGAYLDGNMSTKDLWYSAGNCGVPSGDWIYSQRFKQWRQNHNETWGSTNLTVDDDCANSWVNPSGTITDSGCIS